MRRQGVPRGGCLVGFILLLCSKEDRKLIQSMKTRLLTDPANEKKKLVIDRRMIQPMKVRLIDDSPGRTQLSFSQVFESNVQNVHYSISTEVRVLLKFSNTEREISVPLELFLHKLSLFYSSCLI